MAVAVFLYSRIRLKRRFFVDSGRMAMFYVHSSSAISSFRLFQCFLSVSAKYLVRL